MKFLEELWCRLPLNLWILLHGAVFIFPVGSPFLEVGLSWRRWRTLTVRGSSAAHSSALPACSLSKSLVWSKEERLRRWAWFPPVRGFKKWDVRRVKGFVRNYPWQSLKTENGTLNFKSGLVIIALHPFWFQYAISIQKGATLNICFHWRVHSNPLVSPKDNSPEII